MSGAHQWVNEIDVRGGKMGRLHRFYVAAIIEKGYIDRLTVGGAARSWLLKDVKSPVSGERFSGNAVWPGKWASLFIRLRLKMCQFRET
jgi:hypothetical protein